jgi:hypothetical protein
MTEFSDRYVKLVSRPRSSLNISSALDDAGGVGLPRNIPDIPSSARLARLQREFQNPALLKQLNFVQHIYSLLKIEGRVAMVVPDNVLFEGCAGVSPA